MQALQLVLQKVLQQALQKVLQQALWLLRHRAAGRCLLHQVLLTLLSTRQEACAQALPSGSCPLSSKGGNANKLVCCPEPATFCWILASLCVSMPVQATQHSTL